MSFIPSVKDRSVQQAIAQMPTPIYETLFADGSSGYRPGRSAQDAIFKIRDYGEDGYEWAVLLDLSKYFDTLNHEKLLNMLRREIDDGRVIRLIKRILKSGVMENGVAAATEEGSPQGGPLSPLPANVYLNESDHEYERRGVPVIRYMNMHGKNTICFTYDRAGLFFDGLAMVEKEGKLMYIYHSGAVVWEEK